ncbi:MAG: hypothetical protein R2713_10290 [Ilumatobacteraceae bacterium]
MVAGSAWTSREANIESIGGTVDVQTVVGRGTTFKVKIPLTLAIIPALLVRAGGDGMRSRR